MMANELDMDAYHTEGIDPGQHKVFKISSDIHSFNSDNFNQRFQGSQDFGKNTTDTFNQRFEGEPGIMPSQISGENYSSDLTDRRRSDLIDRVFHKWPDDPNYYVGSGDAVYQNMPYNPNKNRDDLNLYQPIMEDEQNRRLRSMFGPRGAEGGGGGKTIPELAEEHGISYDKAYKTFKDENIPSAYRDWGKEGLSDKALKMREQGKTFKEISDELGVTRDQAAGFIKRYKDANPKQQPSTPKSFDPKYFQ